MPRRRRGTWSVLLGAPECAVAEVAALAGVHDITSAEAERLFGPYLDAVTRLVQHVDGWSAR